MLRGGWNGWPVLGGSWLDNLGFSFLGTGWAAALLLLIIQRAGMANQASTQPGSKGGKSREHMGVYREGVMGFEHL